MTLRFVSVASALAVLVFSSVPVLAAEAPADPLVNVARRECHQLVIGSAKSLHPIDVRRMRAYKSRAHADYVVSGPIDLVAAPDGRKYDFRCVFLPEQGNVLTLKELRFSPHRESAN